MRIVLLCLLVSVGYVLAGQVQSNHPYSSGWAMAYLLYAGPFALLFLSSWVVKPPMAAAYGVISLLAVMLAAYLVFTDQALYLLPMLASGFVTICGVILVISLLIRGFFYLYRSRSII